jgi:DNA-binding transcriptional MerR regulator
MLKKSTPLGLRSREVCDLLKIPSSTLNYWIQIGLVTPSIRGPQGRRVEQYWSVEDIVVVRAIQKLRRHGASLQQVRRASECIVAWGSNMSNAKLFWDGTDIKVLATDGSFVSTLENPGQLAWLLAALPLGTWHAHATKRSRPVPVDVLRERDDTRDELKKRTATPLKRLLRGTG